MTKKEAKIITLEVHQYLVEHPENVIDKKHLPKYFWDKIKNLHNVCPLCETCFEEKRVNEKIFCPECPLKGDVGKRGICRSWSSIKTISGRKKYAQLVIDTVNTWEPEEAV